MRLELSIYFQSTYQIIMIDRIIVLSKTCVYSSKGSLSGGWGVKIVVSNDLGACYKCVLQVMGKIRGIQDSRLWVQLVLLLPQIRYNEEIGYKIIW
jgi:hypothetical protein